MIRIIVAFPGAHIKCNRESFLVVARRASVSDPAAYDKPLICGHLFFMGPAMSGNRIEGGRSTAGTFRSQVVPRFRRYSSKEAVEGTLCSPERASRDEVPVN